MIEHDTDDGPCACGPWHDHVPQGICIEKENSDLPKKATNVRRELLKAAAEHARLGCPDAARACLEVLQALDHYNV